MNLKLAKFFILALTIIVIAAPAYAQKLKLDNFLINGQEDLTEKRIEVNIIKHDSVKVDAVKITVNESLSLFNNPKWEDPANISIETLVLILDLPDNNQTVLVELFHLGKLVDRFRLSERMYYGMGVYTDFYERIAQ